MTQRLTVAAPARTAAAASLLMAAGTAAADHQGYWNSDQDFYVRVSGMPDFDQGRAASLPLGVFGLPGNGGMYCVPTSASNLIGYLNRHGFPNSAGVDGPGALDWTSSNTVPYNTATVYIGFMGIDMNTDPFGGTSNTNNQVWQAVRDRLPQSVFDVTYYSRTDWWSPTSRDMASYMAQGGIVHFCYGRWFVDESGFIPELTERDGGHCITLTKVDKRPGFGRAANEHLLNYADPATGGGLFQQSEFAYTEMLARDIPYVTPSGTTRVHSRLQFALSDERHRIVDSAMAIYPKAAWGTWPTPDTLTLAAGAFVAGGPGDPQIQSFPSPGGRPVKLTRLSPDRGFAAVITEADPRSGEPETLWRLDLPSGEATPVATLGNASTMTFDRFRNVLVTEDATPDAPASATIYELAADLPEGQRSVLVALLLPAVQTVRDATFNDQSDRFELLVDDGTTPTAASECTNNFRQLGTNGFGGFELFDGPEIELPDGFGNFRAADHDPAIDGFWLLTDDGTSVVQLAVEDQPGAQPRPRFTNHAELPAAATDIEPVGDGTVMLQIGGTLSQYGFDNRGLLVPVDAPAASPVAGVALVGPFQVTRSRTNFIPELHSGPSWNNILPGDLEPPAAETADCPADLAPPFEVLDRADIAAFVRWFIDGDLRADLVPVGASNGAMDGHDIRGFVNAFVRGCP